jgi:hypothetical protein
MTQAGRIAPRLFFFTNFPASDVVAAWPAQGVKYFTLMQIRGLRHNSARWT